MSTRTGPSFPLGQIVATPNDLSQIMQEDIMAALQRHMTGDWGELCAEDKLANDCAVMEGTRILSAYRSVNGTKFWIVTEHDRRTTTILLPEDY